LEKVLSEKAKLIGGLTCSGNMCGSEVILRDEAVE
jgi:hypothetical protein